MTVSLDVVLGIFHSYDHGPGSVVPKSVGRLLQGMRTILAWQMSCRHIFKKAAHFQHNSLDCSRFEYDPLLQPCVLPIAKALALIRGWEGPSDNPCQVDQAVKMVKRTFDAKVHAEAVLMHWIMTVRVGFPLVSFEPFNICFAS